MRRFGARLAAAQVMLLLILLGAPAVQAQTASGFSLRPANPDPTAAVSQSYFVYTVAAGATKSDELLVLNTGADPVTLDLYAVDALTGATTGAVYAGRSPAPKEAGAWVRLAQPRLTIPPSSTARLPFDVQVPPGARPGQHLAGIVAQPAEPATRTPDPAAVGKDGQFTITTTTRVVVAVAVTVPGALERKLTVTGVRSAAGASGAQLVVGIRNEGNVLLRPHGRLVLRDPAGAERLTLPLEMDTLLPGGAAEYAVPWPRELAPGEYRAEVRLEATDALPGPAVAAGQATPAPARAELRDAPVSVSAAPAEVVVTQAAQSGPVVSRQPEAPDGLPDWAPYAAGALAVLLIGNLAAALVLYRRRQRG